MRYITTSFLQQRLAKVVPRRDGDIEKVYADTGLANRELGQQAETTLKESMRLAREWEQKLNEEKCIQDQQHMIKEKMI